MAAFSVNVAVRWSDMDVYGHVNNARMVTLLEEARTQLLYDEGARHGAGALMDGLVVVELQVRYRRPVFYSAQPVQVRMWVSELRSASFVLDYAVTDISSYGSDGADAVVAQTRLAPYETVAKRPRRLTVAEREFLSGYRAGDGRVARDGVRGA
ncbi:MAG TPA: thioesterase family protein [Pseudonocardiaceae bacterium]